MARPVARFAVGLVTVAVTGAGACLAPTQIELQLSTDVACDVVTAHRAVIFGDGAATKRIAETNTCAGEGASHDLGSLVLAPSGDREARVTISVALGVTRPTEECAANAYQGCILARRRIAYVPHEPLVLPVALESICVDKPCPEEQTCSGGRCVPADVDDPAFCVGARCTSQADGGPADVSGPDVANPDGATSDAPVSTIDAAPITGLVLSGSDVRGLASDGVWMYFTRSPSDFLRIPMTDLRAGIGSAEVVSAVEMPGGVAVDDINVYVAGKWADGDCVKRWELGSLLNQDGFNCGGILLRGVASYPLAMTRAYFLVSDDGTTFVTETDGNVAALAAGVGHAESDGIDILIAGRGNIQRFSGTFPTAFERQNLSESFVGIAVTAGHFYLTTIDDKLFELPRATSSALKDISPGRFAVGEKLNEVAHVAGDALYVATSRGIHRFTDIAEP